MRHRRAPIEPTTQRERLADLHGQWVAEDEGRKREGKARHDAARGIRPSAIALRWQRRRSENPDGNSATSLFINPATANAFSRTKKKTPPEETRPVVDTVEATRLLAQAIGRPSRPEAA